MTLSLSPVRLGLLVLVCSVASPAAATDFAVVSCEKVDKRLSSPTTVDYTFRAVLTNAGPALPGATATLVSAPGALEILDGVLVFGPVGSNGKIASGDTATLRLDVQTSFDCGALQWSVTPATGNQPPVANAGPDRTAGVGEVITLDGSGSTDADGDSLTFLWTLDAAPDGSRAALADPASVNPTLAIDRAGTYAVRLIVDDGTSPSAPDVVTISTVSSPPVADAGDDRTVFVGQTASLDGSGSTDVDGDPLTYAWSLTAVPPGSAAAIDNPAIVTPTFLVDVPGLYIAELVVHDGTQASAPDTVTIATENSAPVADAGPDQSVTAGDLVLLNCAGSSDADGDPLTYQWSVVARPAGSAAVLANATSGGPSFTADLPGTFVVQLVVGDGTLDSAPDTVTVTTGNAVPVANAGPDQLQVAPGTIVSLDGSGSFDADGHPLTYRWALLAAPAGSAAALDDPTSASPRFTADLAGDYVAQLVVDDGLAESAPDTVLARSVERPVVTVVDTDGAAEAGEVPGTFVVTRTGPATDALTVQYSTSGIAQNGVDYETLPGSVTIPSGSATALVTIVPIDDGVAEGAESVVLTLTAGAAYDVGSPGVALLAIADNDVVEVNVTATDADASEAGPTAGTFTFTRTGDTGSTLIVPFTRGGSAVALNVGPQDYASVGLAVTFQPGGDSVTVTLTPLADNLIEGSETVVLTISPSLGYSIGPSPSATVTIADDPAVVTLTATDPAAAEAGPDPGVFTLARTGGDLGAALRVRVVFGGTASNAGDYILLSGLVTIPSGQASIPLAVTPLPDNLVEGDETVVLTVEQTTPVTYLAGSPAVATVTIADDPATVAVTASDPDASETGPDTGVFTFTRGGGDVAGELLLTVQRGGSATNGDDYVGIGGSAFLVSIPAGQAAATLTITPIPDSLVESLETVVLTILARPAYAIGTPATATVTIADGPPR